MPCKNDQLRTAKRPKMITEQVKPVKGLGPGGERCVQAPPPLDTGRHLVISQVSLDGLGCPTAENEATGQGVHFWCILANETLFGSREFMKMRRSVILRSLLKSLITILDQIPTKFTDHYSRHQDLSL